jgi:hypothetical protein
MRQNQQSPRGAHIQTHSPNDTQYCKMILSTYRSFIFRRTVALPRSRGSYTRAFIRTKPIRGRFFRGFAVGLSRKLTRQPDKVSRTFAIIRSFVGFRAQCVIFTSVTVRTGSKQVCHSGVGYKTYEYPLTATRSECLMGGCEGGQRGGRPVKLARFSSLSSPWKKRRLQQEGGAMGQSGNTHPSNALWIVRVWHVNIKR